VCVGCKFDADSEFYRVTRAAFFLVQDTASGEKQIVQLKEGTLIQGWNQSIGIGNSKLSHMTGSNEQFWIANAADRSVYEINALDESTENIYDTDSLTPHFICLGTKYLLISDSVRNQLGFMKVKKGKMEVVNTTHTPQQAYYQSGLFFLQENDSLLSVYSELALTPIQQVSLKRNIEDIQFDGIAVAHIYTRLDPTKPLHEARYDRNAQVLSVSEFVAGFEKRQYSPYSFQRYNKEWTEPVTLNEQSAVVGSNFGINDVSSFQMDFFEAEVYYLQSDSLFIYNIHEQNRSTGLYFPYQILESYYFIEGIGE